MLLVYVMSVCVEASVQIWYSLQFLCNDVQ